MKRRIFLALGTLVMLIGPLAACAAPASPPAEEPSPAEVAPPTEVDVTDVLPAGMTWSCYSVGASGYVQASAMADAFLKEYGIKVRLIPSGTSIGRLQPVLTGKAEVGFLANENFVSAEASYDYAARDKGPQELRVLLAAPSTIAQCIVGDSDIKTIYDIKEKIERGESVRCGHIPGTPTGYVKIVAFSAFNDLSPTDFTWVHASGYIEQAQALLEGRVDVGMLSATSPIAYSIAESPAGLRWLEMPPDDKEGWARLQKVGPMFEPFRETIGAVIPEEGIDIASYRYPMITVRADADPDFCYAFTKAVVETYDLYKDAFPVMPRWHVELSGVPPADVPFHEGAIKYLKETGVWKAEHDKWNDERIAHLERVKQLWEEALEEGKDKSDEEFATFWLIKRAEALGEEPILEW